MFGAPSLAASARNRDRSSAGRRLVRPRHPSTERACALSGENLLLEVIEVRDAGRVRVRLRGELDLASAPRVTACLQRLSERREQVLLDLDELTFIDMSGLRTLLTAAEDASRDGWALTVTRGSAPVRRLIALVRLDGQLPVDGSSS